MVYAEESPASALLTELFTELERSTQSLPLVAMEEPIRPAPQPTPALVTEEPWLPELVFPFPTSSLYNSTPLASTELDVSWPRDAGEKEEFSETPLDKDLWPGMPPQHSTLPQETWSVDQWPCRFLREEESAPRMTTFTFTWTILTQLSWTKDFLVFQKQQKFLQMLMWPKSQSPSFPQSTTIWVAFPPTTKLRWQKWSTVRKCLCPDWWPQVRQQLHLCTEPTDWEPTLCLIWSFLEEQPPVPPKSFTNPVKPSLNSPKMLEKSPLQR